MAGGQKPFQTKTNDTPKSVVDDKLKPSAEMHILVGGPYSINGEEHRYGHTALRIKNKGGDITYDFGRYGDTRGLLGESGDGILRMWSDFSPYIRSENALGRTTVGFVYAIFEHQAKAVNDYFSSLTTAGKHIALKDRASMKVFKLSSDYHALGPNCTTLSVDGAKQAIPKIDAGSEQFIKPEEVLNKSERFALAASGGAKRLFLPANLQSYLNSSSAVKNTRVDRYGGH